MFLRSCKSILKFNAAVKWSGSKLLRHVTFQRGLLEQTTACLLQGTAELHPVARRNGLHGCGDASIHLDDLQGHAGCWQAMCQPRSHSTLQLWHAAELLTSRRICDRSDFFSSILLRCQKLHPLCQQLLFGSAKVSFPSPPEAVG